ncbi:MAG TPA: O-antigen ligase family protein [Candidatus Dormibacteraeota bacterium]
MITWQVVVVLIGVAALFPIVWRRPAFAIYVVAGAAVVLENFPLRFPDSLTDTIPFFTNLNNSAGLPVSINPAELVMAFGLLAWLFSSALQDGPRAPAGPIRRPYIAFMAVVVIAELHGVLSGANFNITLWELRPQVYGFILFVLTASLVRERRDVVAIAGIFMAGVALKGLVGFYRYFITLHGDLGGRENILGHEDSYFLMLFLVAVVCALIWVRRRQLMILLLMGTPLVALTLLENRRRVAMLAVWASLLVVVALAIWFEPRLRKNVIIVSAIVGAVFAVFVAAFWNTGDGLVGQIVRPVRTVMGQVDQRDYLSDLYRINENADLKFTYQTSPLIGTGFGIPMLVPFPLADISQQDPFWQIITHNSILWIAMRMGIMGMAVFWALIGMIVIEGVRVVRAQEDPLLRAVAVFALAAVVGELVMAYGDKQLEAYRNMIFFGTMVGLIDAIPRLRPVTVTAPQAAETPAPSGRIARTPAPALTPMARRRVP